MEKIKVGIIGLGNCVTPLIQRIGYYSKKECDNLRLIHLLIGKYGHSNIVET